MALVSVIAFIAGGTIATLVLVGVVGYRPPAGAPKSAAVPSPSASPTPSGPSARGYSSMAFDEARGETVLFGGQGMSFGGQVFGDTWTWNGALWQQRHPSAEPSARAGAGMTYYPDRKLVLMWGGWLGDRQASDFWSWDGRVWAPIRAADGPPAEEQSGSSPTPVLTYDSARHLILLIRNNGNHPAAPKQPDVWAWDGSTWSHPTIPGAPLIWGTGAYDPSLSAVVFFGVDSNQNPQTWTLNANAWAKLTSVSAPQFRLDEPSPIVFANTLSTVVLVDGSGGVWRWANGDWARQGGSQQLEDARGYAIVFDSARGVVVRFGAGKTSTWNGQTWK